MFISSESYLFSYVFRVETITSVEFHLLNEVKTRMRLQDCAKSCKRMHVTGLGGV